MIRWSIGRVGSNCGQIQLFESMLINGRVSAGKFGGNTCELPNNTRVDVVLFGAGAKGEDIYIDMSISCVECRLSFASAITAK